jgi:hypothetical protein
MLRHGPALERKQAFLFRLVDIVNELFAMSASVSRAHAMQRRGSAEATQALELADVFCRGSRRKVDQLFGELWNNHDVQAYRTALDVLSGEHVWMEKLVEGLVSQDSAASAPGPAVAVAGGQHGAAAG